ncbi:MAG: RagB/SusD family nutrient uptake outer membrane protein [Chitinophagaceae bacterium]|nr:RagB/SusD family nutrient uptake outer membrane protein [Chitinophagaceae bacterium]
MFIDINKRMVAIGCFLLLMLATSCEKMLDIERPRDSVSDETAFSNNANANSALAGMYGWMMDADGALSFSNGGLSVYAALLADEGYSSLGAEGVEELQFYQNKLYTDNSQVLTMLWDRPYKVIYVANGILEGVAASTSVLLTDSARRQLNGEAKLARAFSYFYLVNLFGDVPLLIKTDITETSTMGRTPVIEVYKQIEQDLKDAYALLPDHYLVSGGTKKRPNRWAAAALLARTYLYQQKWAEAEAQANLVIESGMFQTLSPANVFKPNSNEAIWQLKHEVSDRAGLYTKDALLFMPEYRYKYMPDDYKMLFMLPDFYPLVYPYLTPTVPIRAALKDAFEANDQRKEKWLEENPTPDIEPWNAVPYWYSSKIERIRAGVGETTPGDGYLTVLRISEQYLIRAEARAQIGTDLSGAANDINQIRNKNGLGNTAAATKEQLLDAVMQERRVEFFGEYGHRWFDLKRTGRAATVLGTLDYKQPWSNNHLLMPIPATEIEKNPRLTPNPGY